MIIRPHFLIWGRMGTDLGTDLNGCEATVCLYIYIVCPQNHNIYTKRHIQIIYFSISTTQRQCPRNIKNI